jgi:hypothetical protein
MQTEELNELELNERKHPARSGASKMKAWAASSEARH